MAPLSTRRALAPAAGRARLVLEVPGTVAVCFDAPVVELFETRAEAAPPGARRSSGRTSSPPTSRRPRRIAGSAIRRAPRLEIGVALLDQRAMAGIGNVYKNEILWIEQVSPFAPRRRAR